MYRISDKSRTGLPQPKNCLLQTGEVSNERLKRCASTVQLRGGGVQQNNLLDRWLARLQGDDEVAQENQGDLTSVVTYKGRAIGPPQLISSSNALTPAARFEQQSCSTALIEYNENEHSSTPLRRHRVSSPFESLPSAYSNLDIAHETSGHFPVNRILASNLEFNLADPYSTVYIEDKSSVCRGNSPLYNPSKQCLRREHQDRDSVLATHHTRRAKEYGNLLPLSHERFIASRSKDSVVDVDDAYDDLTDTEELLNALRPERLSLHHVRLPRHEQQNLDISREHQDQATPCSGGLDTLRQEGSHGGVHDDNDSYIGLPDENSSTPEGIFCSSLINIVQDYDDQLQRLRQRAHDSDQFRKGHWLHEKWKYRNVMDKRLKIAEHASDYKVDQSFER